jgi:hypothetical protein
MRFDDLLKNWNGGVLFGAQGKEGEAGHLNFACSSLLSPPR